MSGYVDACAPTFHISPAREWAQYSSMQGLGRFTIHFGCPHTWYWKSSSQICTICINNPQQLSLLAMWMHVPKNLTSPQPRKGHDTVSCPSLGWGDVKFLGTCIHIASNDSCCGLIMHMVQIWDEDFHYQVCGQPKWIINLTKPCMAQFYSLILAGEL